MARVLNIFVWHANVLKTTPTRISAPTYNYPKMAVRHLQIQSDCWNMSVGPDPMLAAITTTPNGINKCRNYY